MPPLLQRVLLALTVFGVALLGLAASTGALADVGPAFPVAPAPLLSPTIPELGGPVAPPPEVKPTDSLIPEVAPPPLWVRPEPSPLQQVLPVESPMPY